MPLLKLVPAGSPQPPEIMPPTRRRRGKKEPPHLQYDELERLFRVIESPRDRAIFRVAYHAGLRASELGLLEVRDYNPRTERISVHRLKGSHSGDHHLCREESRVLHAWLKVRGALPGLLFPSNRRLPIDRTTLDKMMKRYGAMAGLPENLCHFHILKHTCATHLLDKGFNIEQVQDWLGHVNIQSTLVYAKITNMRRGQMAEQLRDSWR
jgi:integrase